MDKDDIIRMARESNLMSVKFSTALEEMWVGQLERFANLVAAAERKDCADIAEYWSCNGMPRTTLADQIRARGQHD